MKALKIFTVAALGLAVLVSCNKESGEINFNGSRTIKVKASIGSMTKVAYDGVKSAFETEDSLSLFAWTGDATSIPNNLVVDNVTNTLGTDGLWTPKVQMKWADMVTSHYFMAVSPARLVKSFTEDKFVLDPSAEKYSESDLLIATNLNGLNANDNPVELEFDHAMATLNVNLAFRNQWTEGNPPVAPNTEALIKGLTVDAKVNAKINYINKAVTATGDQVGVPMNKVKNANWTVLMVPQDGVTTITIELEGNDDWLGGNGTYVFTAAESIPLVSGKITTVNLIVGRDQITLDKDAVTINDWTDGATIDDGEAQQPEATLSCLYIASITNPFYFVVGDTWAEALERPENSDYVSSLVLYANFDSWVPTVWTSTLDGWLVDVTASSVVNPNDVINPTSTYDFNYFEG